MGCEHSVKFRGREPDHRRAVGHPDHIRSELNLAVTRLRVLQINAQAEVHGRQPAHQPRTPSNANANRRRHVSGDLQCRRDVDELERHGVAHLGDRLGVVRRPQEEGNPELKKLEAPVGKYVLAEEAHHCSFRTAGAGTPGKKEVCLRRPVNSVSRS